MRSGEGLIVVVALIEAIACTGSCVPVLYAPGAGWVQDVMRRVANMSDGVFWASCQPLPRQPSTLNPNPLSPPKRIWAGALQFPADFRVADTSLPWQLSEPYDGQWCVGRLPPEGLCPGRFGYGLTVA